PRVGALAPAHQGEPRDRANRRQSFAPDTLGNGQSTPPLQEAPTLGQFAGAMEGFADALGLGAVDVYGTHTGAHIAIEWAIAAPKRVRRVILDGVAVLSDADRAEFLENYAPPQWPSADGAQFHWAWSFIRDQMIFWPHYKKDAAHLRQGGVFDAETLHELTLDVLNNLETYHLPYRAVFQHEVKARLALVRQPVLWLATAGAPLEPGASAALERIADVRTAEIDHDAPPQARAEAIVEFLR
ncbi:MAG: alpha/beta fold hydrolase, partial [Pseudomonadota bacterium]